MTRTLPPCANPDAPTATPDAPALLDARATAALIGVSSRSVYRLADAGKMPRPVRLGRLVRWRRADLDDWIGRGCPAGV